MTAPQGNAHDSALQAGYLELAQAEYDEGDYRDSDTFAERSIRAAGGGDVQPEAISARDLPDNMVGTLTSSRERLMAVLAAGAAQSDPTQAAEAQVAFDCWMQEQEENFQPDDIAACRDRFEAAMAGLGREPAPKPAPPPPATMVEPEPGPRSEERRVGEGGAG